MQQQVNTASSLAARWAALPEQEHHRLIESFTSAELRVAGKRDGMRDDLLAYVEYMIQSGCPTAQIAKEAGVGEDFISAYRVVADALLHEKKAHMPADDADELKAF